jgi:site-specific recombinase XerD
MLARVPQLFAPNPDAARRFLEFFAAQIRNPNTRKAYFRAVSRFAGWCELNGLTELVDLEPVHVAAYVEQLGKQLSPPSVKQHLAAIRMLCDWLVVGQVIATNPAAPVRGPRHVVRKGKTPVLTAEEARTLLDSIPGDTVVGMRDRALIALMVYTFARVGAVIKMRSEDVYVQGRRTWVRLHEKGDSQGAEKCFPCISQRRLRKARLSRRSRNQARRTVRDFAGPSVARRHQAVERNPFNSLLPA